MFENNTVWFDDILECIFNANYLIECTSNSQMSLLTSNFVNAVNSVYWNGNVNAWHLTQFLI